MEHLHALIPKAKNVFPLEITFIFYVQMTIFLGVLSAVVFPREIR